MAQIQVEGLPAGALVVTEGAGAACLGHREIGAGATAGVVQYPIVGYAGLDVPAITQLAIQFQNSDQILAFAQAQALTGDGKILTVDGHIAIVDQAAIGIAQVGLGLQGFIATVQPGQGEAGLQVTGQVVAQFQLQVLLGHLTAAGRIVEITALGIGESPGNWRAGIGAGSTGEAKALRMAFVFQSAGGQQQAPVPFAIADHGVQPMAQI